MRIIIFTATWHYNLWDELILKQEYELLKAYYPDSTFDIFTYDNKSSLLPKDENIRYVSYFPKNIRKNPFSNLRYLIWNIISIAKSDIIFIGWGWLVYADEVQIASTPLWQWNMRVMLAKFFKKKIVWMAVGISYPKARINEIKYLFSWKNTFVSVRDKQSKELLKWIWIEATLLHDSVFFLWLDNHLKLKKGDKSEIDKKTIWVSLRKWYLKNERENIKQLVLYLSRKWYNLHFLSHSIHQHDPLADDLDFLKEFSTAYRIPMTRTMEETLLAYDKVDLVVWMRFHSMILSAVKNIPFLAINYWQKTQELLKDFDYDFALNPKTFDFEEFIWIFEKLETFKDDAKFALKKKCDTITSEISLEYKEFLDGLEITQK
ncbi:MAG: polysaccharide pyruvyl transferase family protein [uncultured bacterium (gcode 4)]|uniref:Polysaccharide pyruvyl transferase family protein n=1 Tax=uncultured bacterium (gcode 4) TaxID=1234023 RepID=K2GC84_9BACT|nr:MAG: polysaccharide pyruvyl transferase family protein [uncultured bacterium (gcode 4)]